MPPKSNRRNTRRSAAGAETPLKEAAVTVSFGDGTGDTTEVTEVVNGTTTTETNEESAYSIADKEITDIVDDIDTVIKDEPVKSADVKESEQPTTTVTSDDDAKVTSVQVTMTTDDVDKEIKEETEDTTMEDTTAKSLELELIADAVTPREEENVEPMDEGAEDGKAAGDEGFQEGPFPETFEKLSQLTVNIGPVRLTDLLSPDLHKLLDTCFSFDVKFESKAWEEGVKHARNRIDKIGYVRIPFEFSHPSKLLAITDRLGVLKIGGRDMSVKFPQQFNDAMKEIKEYVEKTKNDQQEYLKDLFKRRLLVKNFPKNITVKKLQELFPEATRHVIKKFRERRNYKTFAVRLHFETEEAAQAYYDLKKEVKCDDRVLNISFPFKDTLPRKKRTESAGDDKTPTKKDTSSADTSMDRSSSAPNTSRRSRQRFNNRVTSPGNSGLNQQDVPPVAQRQRQQQQQQQQQLQQMVKLQQQMLAQQQQQFMFSGGGQGQRWGSQATSGSYYGGGGMGGQTMGGGFGGGGGNDDAVSMMATLKSTLAMMEQNMMQTGAGSGMGSSMGSGGMGGGRRGGKRKGGGGYDNRNDNKRQFGGGYNYGQYGGNNY